MAYVTYPKYQKTNYSWLPQIPTHWTIKPLKFSATCNDETLPETTDSDYEFDYVDISSVSLIEGIKQRERITFEKAPSRARRVVRRGDSIVSTVRTYLKAVATIDEEVRDLIVSTGFAVLRPGSELQQRYLGYFVQAQGFVDTVVAHSTGVSYPAILASEIMTIPVIVPTVPEQEVIVSFLDRETARIDTLVRKRHRLLDLLEEKRLAAITHAITKGLNPNAPMRDGGIDWLGEIPAHWEVLPLTRVVHQFVDYRGATPTKLEDGVPLITATQIKNGRIDHSLDPVFISEEEYGARMTRGFPEKGDVLVTTEAPLGETAQIEDERVAPGQRIIMMKPDVGKVTKDYLFNHFRSDVGRTELLSRASGSTASGIRADRLRATKVLVPPLDEQKAITTYIAKAISYLPSIVATIEAQILKLQEYRSALITNAVIGKIDLRTEAKNEAAT